MESKSIRVQVIILFLIDPRQFHRSDSVLSSPLLPSQQPACPGKGSTYYELRFCSFSPCLSPPFQREGPGVLAHVHFLSRGISFLLVEYPWRSYSWLWLILSLK